MYSPPWFQEKKFFKAAQTTLPDIQVWSTIKFCWRNASSFGVLRSKKWVLNRDQCFMKLGPPPSAFIWICLNQYIKVYPTKIIPWWSTGLCEVCASRFFLRFSFNGSLSEFSTAWPGGEDGGGDRANGEFEEDNNKKQKWERGPMGNYKIER